MSTIDIILTCLLGFSAILGFFRGVSKGSIRFLSIVGAVLLAYYIGIPIAYGIMSTSLGSESLTMAYNSLLPQDGIFTESLVDLSYTSSQQLCSSALTELSFPTFFQGMFLSNIFVTTSTVGVAISSSFAYWTLLAIFFIVFLVILLVLFRFLFNTILGPILGKDGRGIVGRILGAVRGFLKMTITVLILMFLLVLISNTLAHFGNVTLQNYLVSDLCLDNDNFTLGKLLYQTCNAFLGWINVL